MRWPRLPGLPLLGRELTQQAASWRTPVLRLAYGAALLLVFAAAHDRHMPRSVRPGPQLLGRGRPVVHEVGFWLLVSVYVLQPAMMAGAIAGERQGHTLELLSVSGLGPGQIVLQKLTARLVPMLTVGLLALPLLGAAYALGGLSASELAILAGLLVLAVLQVGSVSLFASTVSRTPVGAIALTYLIGLGAHLCAPLAEMLGQAVEGWSLGRSWRAMVEVFLPSRQLATLAARPAADAAWQLIPLGISAVAFVALARLKVLRAPPPPSRSALRRLFAWLDGMMYSANALTGGVELTRRSTELPGDAPVAWRTVTRGTVGQPQYVLRVQLVLLLPIAFLCAVHLIMPGRAPQATALTWSIAGIWALALLAVGSTAASAVAAERAGGTLELLLTTPLTGRQLVLEWMAGVRRVALMACPALLALTLTEAYVESGPLVLETLAYLVAATCATGVLLALIAWVGMGFGLLMTRRGWAVLATLISLSLWIAVPWLLADVLAQQPPEATGRSYRSSYYDLESETVQAEPLLPTAVMMVSPAFAVIRLETEGPKAFFPALIHILCMLGIVVLLRDTVLSHSDRRLGRPR